MYRYRIQTKHERLRFPFPKLAILQFESRQYSPGVAAFVTPSEITRLPDRPAVSCPRVWLLTRWYSTVCVLAPFYAGAPSIVLYYVRNIYESTYTALRRGRAITYRLHTVTANNQSVSAFLILYRACFFLPFSLPHLLFSLLAPSRTSHTPPVRHCTFFWCRIRLFETATERGKRGVDVIRPLPGESREGLTIAVSGSVSLSTWTLHTEYRYKGTFQIIARSEEE